MRLDGLSGVIKRNWLVILVILSVSAAVAYNYYSLVDRPNLDSRIELHNSILNGTAPSPYRHRILVPIAVEPIILMISQFTSYSLSFLIAYALYDFLGIACILIALYAYLRLWFPKYPSLVGVLFVAATMTVALRDHYFQPWSLLETALFTISLLLIFRRKHALLGITVVLAALNRETAIMIPLAYLLMNIEVERRGNYGDSIVPWNVRVSRRVLMLFLTYLALCGAILIGIRAFMGDAQSVEAVGELFATNVELKSLLKTVVNLSLFMGIFWVAAALGFRQAPAFVRRTVLIVPFYVVPIVVLGLWFEVRTFMPLYAVLVPLAVAFVASYGKGKS